MNKTRAGFTLMEIMVVIIVIAVLASVAGPMIGSITDQGRASATKSKMSALKSAMLAYQSDVGRLPFNGKPGDARDASLYASNEVLGLDSAKNVLVNDTLGNSTFNITNYSRKWKGPYMDSEPGDFMLDAWGNPFRYGAKGNNVYLWSSGADSAFANSIEDALSADKQEAGDNDDIAVSIAKVRRTFTGTTAW